MTITVLAIIDPQPVPVPPLSKVMNERLRRFADELQVSLLSQLRDEYDCDDLVVYLSYNSKYAVRWKIVNDVPARVEIEVAKRCADLGYILWKGSLIYSFKSNNNRS